MLTTGRNFLMAAQSKSLVFHPAADAFPMMDAARFGELKADIEVHGLREPITLCDGMILDGRNRHNACEELGVKPRFQTFEGDPWAYVWSLNGQRRDLVAEQRYLIWKFCNEQSDAWDIEKQRIADEANAKRSKRQKGVSKTKASKRSATECRTTFDHKAHAAKATASKTNPGAVARGDKLAKDRPDLAEAVRHGKLKPAEAHRRMKRDEVADKVEALPAGKFTVLYADPPWSYGDKCDAGGVQAKGVEQHYPAMSLSQLKAMDVPGLAAQNSVLFLWATSPLLPDALELAKAWGFTYKASFIWDKVKHNMGHYNSVRHEFLLVCTQGSCTPQKVKLFDSVQSIPRTKHSEKPKRFRTIIETLYPKGRKIELFARQKAQGWTAWGNQAPTTNGTG